MHRTPLREGGAQPLPSPSPLLQQSRRRGRAFLWDLPAHLLVFLPRFSPFLALCLLNWTLTEAGLLPAAYAASSCDRPIPLRNSTFLATVLNLSGSSRLACSKQRYARHLPITDNQ